MGDCQGQALSGYVHKKAGGRRLFVAMPIGLASLILVLTLFFTLVFCLF